VLLQICRSVANTSLNILVGVITGFLISPASLWFRPWLTGGLLAVTLSAIYLKINKKKKQKERERKRRWGDSPDYFWRLGASQRDAVHWSHSQPSADAVDKHFHFVVTCLDIRVMLIITPWENHITAAQVRAISCQCLRTTYLLNFVLSMSTRLSCLPKKSSRHYSHLGWDPRHDSN
jgi:hypothetical protein